jgi:hypothetical protein
VERDNQTADWSGSSGNASVDQQQVKTLVQFSSAAASQLSVVDGSPISMGIGPGSPKWKSTRCWRRGCGLQSGGDSVTRRAAPVWRRATSFNPQRHDDIEGRNVIDETQASRYRPTGLAAAGGMLYVLLAADAL